MDRLALVCEDIQRHASRLKKIAILAEYFKSLNEEDLTCAVQFLSAGPPRQTLSTQLYSKLLHDKTELKIGRSVLREALRVASGWDKETLSICHAQVGDTGETTALLMRGLSANEPISLADAEKLYERLFLASNTAKRVALLAEIFRKYKPLTVKYFVKVITRGLRIGLMGRQVKEALAQAERHEQLTAIEARLFHPADFMLAKPLERIEDLEDPSAWSVEDKYDGIRAQIHFDHGIVRIFSRGLEEITASFPEIVAACATLPGNGLIDGEILAWRNGRALNFNILQRRLAKKTCENFFAARNTHHVDGIRSDDSQRCVAYKRAVLETPRTSG